MSRSSAHKQSSAYTRWGDSGLIRIERAYREFVCPLTDQQTAVRCCKQSLYSVLALQFERARISKGGERGVLIECMQGMYLWEVSGMPGDEGIA